MSGCILRIRCCILCVLRIRCCVWGVLRIRCCVRLRQVCCVVGWLHSDSQLAFGHHVRQTHRTHSTHSTQGIIFADVVIKHREPFFYFM